MLACRIRYDSDSSGYIERGEIEVMLSEVYGGRKALSDPAYTITKAVMYKLTRREDDAKEYGTPEERRNAPQTEVSAPEFERFSQRHPSLLYPAYQFQEKLQKAVLGRKFWEAKAAQRLRIKEGTEATTLQFLKAMMNEGLLYAMSSLHKLLALILQPSNLRPNVFAFNHENAGDGNGHSIL